MLARIFTHFTIWTVNDYGTDVLELRSVFERFLSITFWPIYCINCLKITVVQIFFVEIDKKLYVKYSCFQTKRVKFLSVVPKSFKLNQKSKTSTGNDQGQFVYVTSRSGQQLFLFWNYYHQKWYKQNKYKQPKLYLVLTVRLFCPNRTGLWTFMDNLLTYLEQKWHLIMTITVIKSVTVR